MRQALERVKKKKIGGFLRSLNSPEYIANQFTRYAFNESSLFDALTVLESLTVQDLQEVAKLLLSEEKNECLPGFTEKIKIFIIIPSSYH